MQTLRVVDGFDDRRRWDDYVRTSTAGHLFQSWGWGEFQRGLGGLPLRVALLSGETVRGCAQLLVFNTKTKTKARPFAYLPRGPVVEAEEPLAKVLIEAILRVSIDAGAHLLRVEPQWPFTHQAASWLMNLGFTEVRQTIMPPRTLLVDLTPPVERIWNSIRGKTRNRIRAAEKRGVDVRVGGQDDLPSFMRLHVQTTARHGLRQESERTFVDVARAFLEDDVMRLYLARGDGIDVAGILVFEFGGVATYLWGASSAEPKARRLNPNHLLQWTAMRWAKELGCTTYDLFGVPDHDLAVLEAEFARRTHGFWNLYEFKRGFGGTVHRHLGAYERVFRTS